jgi:tRNA (guanine10-N2)-dimethyltransferase
MTNLNKTHIDNTSKYLYFLNYKDELKELCNLEMKSFFGYIPSSKDFFSNVFISPSRSIFIKAVIEISHEASSFEELEKLVKDDQLYYDGYKITYLKSDHDVSYEDRLKALRMIGFAIEGDFSMDRPKIEFALTKINQKWVFGHYLKNDPTWTQRKQKLYNYSYALDNTLAKTLVNIAVGNNDKLRVVDPCCGIGTTVIEGLNMGIHIKGYDLNPNVVEKCNQNLQYFGFDNKVEHKNIIDIKDYFDVAIVDLPYGKFSKTTLNEQTLIITKTKEIAKKAVFVSMVDMNNLLASCGFTNSETCFVQKRDKFSRYISVCY